MRFFPCFDPQNCFALIQNHLTRFYKGQGGGGGGKLRRAGAHRLWPPAEGHNFFQPLKKEGLEKIGSEKFKLIQRKRQNEAKLNGIDLKNSNLNAEMEEIWPGKVARS